MADESVDHARPPRVVFGRRGIISVPEGVGGRSGGKLVGHEAQLDERTNAVRQQAIVDLIDVAEVVRDRALFALAVESDFVVEDGMKPNVLEAGYRLNRTQVSPIVVA